MTRGKACAGFWPICHLRPTAPLETAAPVLRIARMSTISSNVGFSAIQNARAGIARGMAALNRDAAVVANGLKT